MNRLLTAISCVLVLIGIGAMWLAPDEHYAAVVDEDATLLYYNSPAAVQTPMGIAIGYITATGSVEVTILGEDRLTLPVHDYGAPDDHAAPALWWDGERLLIATSFHGSDLFLYQMNEEGQLSRLCQWEGRYTYPRFFKANTGIELLVRLQVEPKIGDLVSLKIGTTCGAPTTLAQANPGQILYAAAPVGETLLWSVYDFSIGRNNTVWIDGLSHELSENVGYEPAVAWSANQDYFAVTRLSTQVGNQGAYIAEVYDGDQLVLRLPPYAARYYPSGIVLSDIGQALLPNGDTIVRSNTETWTALTSCKTRRSASRGQFVEGGNGSYVYVETQGTYNPKGLLASRVMLCIPDVE